MKALHPLAGLLVLATALSSCAAPARGSRSSDDTSWYEFAWLRDSPYAPTFEVLDTESSLGPYAPAPKRIELGDLVRYHGHACDGLVTAAAALWVGLHELYPDGVIDRTDTGCISNNSPCFGDVSAYLTGGRVRFGTQKIDPDRGASFLVHRFSTGETVEVELRKGVFPAELHGLEHKLKSGAFTPEELRRCQREQWDFARGLLEHPLDESFQVRRVDGFVWEPDRYEHLGRRGDIINRDAVTP
ncbi:MAG TPA: hypothetical protein ENJ09_05760 [Planctomycetes bacterium]|nr:hypothetical protein [Planctomycetota bacterium]